MEIKTIPEKICIREVNENIRLVELGLPLTRSLRVLNTSCQFRKKFNEFDKRVHPGLSESDKEKKNEYQKEYFKRPVPKAKQLILIRKYQRRPEVKERMRLYQQRPEVKVQQRIRAKKYYEKNKVKILKKMKENYQRKKNEILDR